jgi:hypothetical protein
VGWQPWTSSGSGRLGASDELAVASGEGQGPQVSSVGGGAGASDKLSNREQHLRESLRCPVFGLLDAHDEE